MFYLWGHQFDQVDAKFEPYMSSEFFNREQVRFLVSRESIQKEFQGFLPQGGKAQIDWASRGKILSGEYNLTKVAEDMSAKATPGTVRPDANCKDGSLGGRAAAMRRPPSGNFHGAWSPRRSFSHSKSPIFGPLTMEAEGSQIESLHTFENILMICFLNASRTILNVFE